MKTFVSVLVVLALTAASSLAETVLLQEDFNGTVGTSVADGVSGWAGAAGIVRSSDTLDVGNSASWAGGSAAWLSVDKTFTHTSVAGETYTLTATLYAPGTGGEDAEIHIRNSSDPYNQGLGAAIAYGSLNFALPNVENYFVIRPQPTAATDVKLVMQGTTADFFYRTHKSSDPDPWTHAGQKTGLGWSCSVYDEVHIGAHGGYAGGIDSILLTSSVPEPTSCALLASGLIGLLCYAWRKRK